MSLFDQFAPFDIATTHHDPWPSRRRRPPVLLLHGIPETHLMWHRVAPRLAERFTVDRDRPSRLRGQRHTTPCAVEHAQAPAETVRQLLDFLT